MCLCLGRGCHRRQNPHQRVSPVRVPLPLSALLLPHESGGHGGTMQCLACTSRGRSTHSSTTYFHTHSLTHAHPHLNMTHSPTHSPSPSPSPLQIYRMGFCASSTDTCAMIAIILQNFTRAQEVGRSTMNHSSSFSNTLSLKATHPLN